MDDHAFHNISDVLNNALRNFLDGGFVVIEPRDSEYFIQFRKYAREN